MSHDPRATERRLLLPRRQFLGMAAAGAAGLALGACGDDDTATTSDESTSTTSAGSTAPSPASDGPSFDGVTITTAVYARNHASSPLFWQQFAPEGLTIEVIPIASGTEANQAMEDGDLDFALMGLYNSLVEAEQGFGSKIVSMCARQGLGLIARADSGITSVEDLAGKTLAVPPPGQQVLVLTRLLQDAGLDIDTDLTGVPLGYADHVAALERGDIDAFMGTEPPCTASVVSGVGVRVDGVYDTDLGNFNTAMWCAPKNQDDADLIEAVVKMQRDAAEFLSPDGENDADEWRTLLVDDFEYEVPVYEEVLSNIGAEWRFGDDRKAAVEAAAEILLTSGQLTTEPDLDALYLLDAVKALQGS